MILTLLRGRWKRRAPPVRRTAGEWGLGGGEDLFVGAAVKGELVPVSTCKDGVPRAPVRLGTENNQLFSAILTREDDLLLGIIVHERTSLARSGHRFRHESSEPLGFAGGNFTHLQGGHKINEAQVNVAYGRCKSS
jgi:hypothetical protein